MFHLHIIVLSLEATDEPQAIFETLNTGGAPLSPIDLVKNWLLWEAVRGGHDEASCAALHMKYWKAFDTDAAYWRQKVGTGHAARPRVDGFLVNWLTERLRIPVTEGHVYETFLDQVAKPACLEGGSIADVPALMASIHVGAKRFGRLDAPGAGGSRFENFLHRLKAMNVVVLHPLLMHLLGRPGSGTADLDACAVALESFLVRRLVCNSGTRGYGLLFLNLLIAVAKAGPTEPAAPTINEFLRAGQSASNIWPDDTFFQRYWATRDAYKGRVAIPLMVLRALEEEDWRRDKYAMPVAHFDWSGVQIEHIMPQKWEKHWTLPAGGDASARNEVVHHIGNLTLVSPGLNPALSNGPWAAKRPELGKHTHLRLTLALTAKETWDEAAIDARSADLLGLALSVWPGPSRAASVTP